MGWSDKYKKSIDCNNPKGFSQKAHCQGRKKKMEEGTLHKWFKGSKSKDGKGGWVNVVTGGTCASDKPGEGTPKCVSSAKRASMSKKERLSAARRKKAADPGQQQKTGAAKPTYVSTDPKKKMKEGVEDINKGGRRDAMKDAFNDMRNTKYDPTAGKKRGKKLLDRLIGVPPVAEENVTEAKDKKGKGSGTKDACYHKVKSRYSVWPSAYASGALVKCRKVGAANWGNSKKESFSNWREDMLLEGIEDKLRGMSASQIEDLIKSNPGAEDKIRKTLAKMKSATPNPQGKGAQLPNIPKQPASTSSATPRETYQRGGSDRVSYQRRQTVTRADVQGGTEAAKRAASGQGRYKPGVGVTPDFKLDPKFKPPGSRGMGGKVRPRGRGRLGLAIGAATLAAPFVVGAIKKAFNKEDYDYSNWRDDFKATEYESVDIIETEPLQPTKGIGSDMLGEAKKCWKGYKKTGTQKLFGKTYNRCEKIKKEEVEIQEAIPGYDKYDAAMKAIRKKKLSGRELIDALKYAGGLRPKTEKEVNQKLGEDWQKSNRKDGVDGMSQKSVNAYKRENPGSKLQTAVTGKVKKGSKDAKRRKSFCSRSKGQKDMHNIDCSKTPDKKICKARKRWRC